MAEPLQRFSDWLNKRVVKPGEKKEDIKKSVIDGYLKEMDRRVKEKKDKK